MLSSVRRVKKGPGRRPQSAKRQRFMELRARGWSILAAAREVGVSRTSGANWARGYKTYRNGEVVGFVAPLDHLAVREVSARYLYERRALPDSRPAAGGREHSRDRRRARPGAVDNLAGAAPQRRPGGWLPSVRCPPSGVARRARPHRRRVETIPALRSSRLAALFSSSAGARSKSAGTCARRLSRAAAHVAMSREHLPGRLPAAIPAAASNTFEAPHRGTIPAADRPRPPPRPAACRPAPAPIPSSRCSPSMIVRSHPRDRSEPGHWEGYGATWKSHAEWSHRLEGRSRMV